MEEGPPFEAAPSILARADCLAEMSSLPGQQAH